MEESKKGIKFKDLLYSRRKNKSPIKYLVGILLIIYALYNKEAVVNGVTGFLGFFSQ